MTHWSSPVRVLVVDDSQVMRQLLSTLLAADPEIEVVGTAADPHIAREQIKALNPDVVTLDVEMPHMDGLTFLRKIMTLRPMPVVMISTLTQSGAETTLEALEIGAVDFIAKPTDLSGSLTELTAELQRKVKAAAGVRLGVNRVAASAPARQRRAPRATGKIVFVGASTGGVEALKALLLGLPADLDHPAHAAALHRRIRQPARPAMPDGGLRSGRRPGDRARARLYRARFASSRDRPCRPALSLPAFGRRAGERPSAVGRRPVPLRRARLRSFGDR